jgi:hypothetical protein
VSPAPTRRRAAVAAPRARGGAPHHHHRLGEDRGRHLALPHAPVDEPDRHLHYSEPRAQGR